MLTALAVLLGAASGQSAQAGGAGAPAGAPAARQAAAPFTELRLFGDGSLVTTDIVVGDVNGDGHLDLVVASATAWGGTGGQDMIYLNDGAGNFDWPGAGRGFGTGSDNTRSVALGDLDDDGDLDIAATIDGQQSVVYLNDGAGGFHSGAIDCGAASLRCFGGPAGAGSDVALGDVDGDGDLDIVTVGAGQDQVYLNDGTGHFYYGSLGCAGAGVLCFGTGSDETGGAALGDLDGDGDLDLAVIDTGNGYPSAGLALIYWNPGGGAYYSGAFDCAAPPAGVTCIGSASPKTSVVPADVNGDGWLDLVVGASYAENVVYLNDGSGGFEYGPLDCASARVRCFGGFATTSVAPADLDGDGDLDLVVGNTLALWAAEPNLVCYNDGGSFGTCNQLGAGNDYTNAVAAADLDGDGSLDAIVGNDRQQNVIYLNDGAGSLPQGGYVGTWSGSHNAVALADLDGDGALDVIDAGGWQSNTIAFNDGHGAFPSGAWDCSGARMGCFGDSRQPNYGLAVGDVDGDGDIDLATARAAQSAVLLNDGAGGFWKGDLDCGAPNVRCFGSSTDETLAVALGDMDGDGDLDVVAGTAWRGTVYLNDGSGNFYTGTVDCAAPPSNVRCFGSSASIARSLALGDVDADGDLDIAVGETGANHLYLNDGNGGFYAGPVDCSAPPAGARCFGSGTDQTTSVSFADMNGDGSLDLVVGNWGPNAVYLNDGSGGFSFGALNCSAANVRCFGTGSDTTTSVRAADVDGDGDLDLITGNRGRFDRGEPSLIYLNDGTASFGLGSPARGFWTANEYTAYVTAGDLDGDGTVDVVTAQQSDWMMDEDAYDLNPARHAQRLANSLPEVTVVRPGTTDSAESYSTAEVLASTQIPISYTLYDREGDPARFVRVSYSPDGGGRWLPAVAAAGTITTNLSASPSGVQHEYVWDTFASGFFGQSDNVVIRVQAYPSLRPSARAVPGPYQWPYAATSTYPFRVRGTQVRVLTGTLPAAGAIVYRLPAGQVTGAEPLANAAGEPFRTGALGYLQGRGDLALGDRLVALLPISTTAHYTIYATSAAPTEYGLDLYSVNAPGVQTLNVSADHLLVLLNLNVSLEWDARNDTLFLAQLEQGFQRSSQLLYDVTNGQMALGTVSLYYGKSHWVDADVVIYASNAIRPNANMGGVVVTGTNDLGLTGVITNAYLPGQVRMGAGWSRTGSGLELGEDWARALAHEVAHYALYQPDNYVGFDAEGLVVSPDCIGSVMTNAYSDAYSELLTRGGWTGECLLTVAEHTTGRPDWESVLAFYPMLSGAGGNPGPAVLPLAVTRVEAVAPPQGRPGSPQPAQVLPADWFELFDEWGHPLSVPGGRGYLFKTKGTLNELDDHVLAEGSPVADLLQVRGAEPGDRLCVYDTGNTPQRVGCAPVGGGPGPITLYEVPDWAPQVAAAPISSTLPVLAITVTNEVPLGALWAQVLPAYGFSNTFPITSPYAAMVPVGSAPALTFTQVITLSDPAYDGYVRVWVPGSNPLQEALVQWSLGSGWAANRGGFNANRGGFNANRGGFNANRGAFNAPVNSPDGQVIIYTPADIFADSGNYSLQGLPVAPDLPGWLAPVGQAYRFAAEKDMARTIVFQYLQREVPAGYEWALSVYYSPDEGGTWQRLHTRVEQQENLASARMPAANHGAGLYALVATLELPALEVGWNQFSYPLPVTRTVTETLASIDGSYTSVLLHAGAAWKLHDQTVLRDHPALAAHVNDLPYFEFARSYWLYATEVVTPYIGVPGGANPAIPNAPVPATFYGWITPTTGFTPTAGLPVTAELGGTVCGRGQVVAWGGGLAYHVHVEPESAGNGCGVPAATVAFRVGPWLMQNESAWDNRQAWYLGLDAPEAAVAGLAATNDGPTVLGQATTLTATIAEGTRVVYSWDFGDGATGTGAVVTHAYTGYGTYAAVVTATNALGSVSASTAVDVDEPVAGLVATSDGPTLLGQPTTLTATISAGTRVAYEWDFGDGTLGGGAVVTHTYPALGVYTATVTATNTVGASAAAVAVQVDPAADLALGLAAPATVPAGESLRYWLVVSNQGPSDATGVIAVQDLPAGVRFTSASPGCSHAAGQVVCDLGALQVGDARVVGVTVDVDPNVRGSITSTAQVTALQGDPYPDDNVAAAPTEVYGLADLSLQAEVGHTTVYAGALVSYTLTVRNAGPSGATGVVLSDTLPTGVTLLAAPQACTLAGRQLTCPLGGLPRGGLQRVVLTVQTDITTPGPLVNVAEVFAAEADPAWGNNSVTTTVVKIFRLFASIMERNGGTRAVTPPGRR